MARGRMINNAILRDKKVNDLSCDTSRLAFTWLITLSDKEGRVHGDPFMVRSMVFPRRDDITVPQITSYIQEWERAGFIIWYEADGDKWIQFVNFDKNQPGLRKDREPGSIIPPTPADDGGEVPEDVRQPSGNMPGEEKGREEKGIESSCADAQDGSADKPAKRPSARQQALACLEQSFSDLTGVPPPKRSTKKQRSGAAVRWWNPLGEIWEMVGKDTDKAKRLCKMAYQNMRAGPKPLTVSAPQSILQNAIAIYGERRKEFDKQQVIIERRQDEPDESTGDGATVEQPESQGAGNGSGRPRRAVPTPRFTRRPSTLVP